MTEPQLTAKRKDWMAHSCPASMIQEQSFKYAASIRVRL